MLSTWRARGRAAVVLVSAVLLAVQAPVLAAHHGVWVGLALALAAAHVVSVPLALVRPVPAALLSVLAFAAQALVLMPDGVTGWPWAIAPQVLTQLMVLLVLSVVAGWRPAVTTLVVLLAVGVGLSVAGTAWNDLSSSLAAVVLFGGLAVLLGALGAVGDQLVRSREALAREQTISAEEHARRTLAEEKARVARELHDVIAHNMSLITVQARSAAHRVDGVGAAAEKEFAEIADRAGEALRQMRGVLDVLRTEPGQSGRVPVPGLADLPALVEEARATGQQVELDGDVPPARSVPPEVGAAAYRILQEALSNARRHAPDAPVAVLVGVVDDDLEVRASNPLAGPVPAGTGGHGVVGMRERASAVGGTVTAGGPTPEEYVVLARLPMHAADPEGAGSR